MRRPGPLRRSPRTRGATAGLVVVLLALLLRIADANPAVAQTASLTAHQADRDPGLDATRGVWRDVPGTRVALSAQTVTYPAGGGLGASSFRAPTVTARALHHDDTLFIALEWEDRTVDDSTVATEDFADGAAVQLPSDPESSVPAACMGQADRSVNIWHWRADTQQGVPSRPPSGYVDLYPSTDDTYFPARSAGNPYAAPGESAVQNLVSGGFGTLTSLDDQSVVGEGHHDQGRWSTVFARSFQAPGAFQPAFADGQVIDVAFAVWNGSLEQRNGTKSVTSFVRLELSSDPVPADRAVWRVVGWAVLAVFVLGMGNVLLHPSRTPVTTGDGS